METLFYLIDNIGMIICFLCVIVLVKEKPSTNQKNMLMMFVCGFIISVGNALEFRATLIEEAIVATKVAYIGKSFIMYFALRFVTGFSTIRMPEKVFSFLEIIDFIILLVTFSCDRHALYYREIKYIYLESGRGMLYLEKGVLYYIWALLFLLSGLTYIGIAGYEIKKGSQKYKPRMTLILLAPVVPFIMVISFMFFSHPMWNNFDPTTLAVVVPELMLLLDVKLFGFPNTMELAQQRALEDTKDGVMVIDSDCKNLLYINPMAEKLFPQLTIGENADSIKRIFQEKENVRIFNGRRYEIRISEIKNERGKQEIQGYLAWIFDMTFINQYTEDMIQLKEESDQANMAKTNFLAHMSHEIRTPMNAIVGYSELALQAKDVEQTDTYLKNIKEAAKTLLYLINEILDITKIETGKMKLVKVSYQLEQMVYDLKNMMTPQAEKKGLEFSVEFQNDISHCLIGDSVKLQEICTNLINNALKYTHEGSVALRVSIKEQTKKRVLLHIEVEDTGMGIEEKNFSKVFAKFEQFDKRKNYNVEGSGLGLAIVKSFVDLMDGRIDFESTYGKGTKFIVEVWQDIDDDSKQIKNDEAEADTACFNESEVKIRRGHILVVDDNELNCDVAQGILETMGMSVDTSPSGIECLKRLENKECFDLIFMDHMMPEIDGVETMHRIRSNRQLNVDIPIILLTANAVSGVREEMLEEGFDDFLSKPIDIDQLRHILIKYLGTE